MSAATIVAIAVVAQPAAGLWRRARQGLGSVVDEAVAGSATTVAAGESSVGDESAGTEAVSLACVLSAVWTWVSGASASSDVSWCAFVVSITAECSCLRQGVNNCLHAC